MRRGFVLTAAVVLAAVFPLAAHAAQWKGTVVAKDSSRSAVAVASRGGVVRTVRVAAGISALKPGQHVLVRAKALPDGTFTTQKIRVLGQAKQARIHGVVVRHRASRTTISAGGTVFTLRMRQQARRVQAGDGSLEPGDEIVASVSVDGGGLEADDIDEVGHVDLLELEGRFASFADGVLELRIGDGVVHVTIPPELTLPDLAEGDELSLLVSVGEDGSFTATAVQGENGPEDDGGVDLDEHSDQVEVEGVITSIDLENRTITIQPGEDASPVTCDVPEDVDLSTFTPQTGAELRCSLVDGNLVLVRLASEGQVVESGGAGQGDDGDDQETGDDEQGDQPGEDGQNEEPGHGDEPGGDQPGGDEPGDDTPGGDEPGGDEPGGDEPGGDEPGGDTPGGDEPGGDTPGGDAPGGGGEPI